MVLISYLTPGSIGAPGNRTEKIISAYKKRAWHLTVTHSHTVLHCDGPAVGTQAVQRGVKGEALVFPGTQRGLHRSGI